MFPGSPEQYDGTTDVTDARLLARQLEWAATSPAGANEAFNIVNGDTFHWRDMWEVVASGLGVEPAPYPGTRRRWWSRWPTPRRVWRRHRRAVRASSSPTWTGSRSWWHTDSDLGRTVETHADMTKSREAGFPDAQDSGRSFLDLFDRLRAGAGHPRGRRRPR